MTDEHSATADPELPGGDQVVVGAITSPLPEAGQAEGTESDPAEPPSESSGSPFRSHTPMKAGLLLAALGVVFGDIGTSPLYGLKEVFNIDHGAVKPTPGDVYGVISLVFWSITLIVSYKYLLVVMRADNDGEGGVMALAALARRMIGPTRRRAGVVIVLAIIGASLFYGDSVITPAISVLSAVEGVEVVAPGLHDLVLPIAIVILTVLFFAQRYGTHRVGALFGPVMALWFACLAVAGLNEIVRRPSVIRGLSPTYAASFVVEHPGTTFIAMGAIVLCITGAEALYADMGHFGRPPIVRAWFLIVFPALTLQYLGQAGLILHDPSTIANPFYLLLPGWARVPMIVLATAATVIASQAVISGAFSVSRQASQLGLVPPLTVRQTSDQSAGQVFLPAINAVLFVGVLVLMLVFRTSERLATAYGVSVTGALIIDTVLLLFVAKLGWKWAWWKIGLFAVVVGGTELVFFSANLSKIAHGGWLPLLIAFLVFSLMSTWRRGRDIVTANRIKSEGPLTDFVDKVAAGKIQRIPGTAVFPHPTKETTPLALKANVQHNHVLQEHVVIFSAFPRNIPRVVGPDRISVDHLESTTDGILHVTLQYGYFEEPDIPHALAECALLPEAELDIDPADASYFVSRAVLTPTHAPGMNRWRKRLFIALARNAANPIDQFRLPESHTVVLGSRIDV